MIGSVSPLYRRDNERLTGDSAKSSHAFGCSQQAFAVTQCLHGLDFEARPVGNGIDHNGGFRVVGPKVGHEPGKRYTFGMARERVADPSAHHKAGVRDSGSNARPDLLEEILHGADIWVIQIPHKQDRAGIGRRTKGFKLLYGVLREQDGFVRTHLAKKRLFLFLNREEHIRVLQLGNLFLPGAGMVAQVAAGFQRLLSPEMLNINRIKNLQHVRRKAVQRTCGPDALRDDGIRVDTPRSVADELV